ncbi:hypothetical protein NGRA_0410 [Nosema granulosis]|uniref:Uncharacterized protein n=1 Tax=Nosema granulosis TaxID=83296 RepID=A0A9P6H0X5_9MICR|nr:hypothetical protein NGRA_0410 [Nosema granulosis]
MDEVRQIVESYKTIKAKTQYLKNYLEHVDATYKKSSDLLFRAAQIPRDAMWNDPNIINILEMGERQRVIFDEMSSLHSHTVSKDIDDLMVHINEEINLIEKDLGDIIKLNNTRMEQIEQTKNQHRNSWVKGFDPWITDIKLKLAIKNMYQIKETNDLKVYSKMNMYNDKLKYTQEMYLSIISNFIKIQRSLFLNMSDSLNFQIQPNDEPEKYFDAVGEENNEKKECKIISAYNGLIESMSKDLIKSNITVYKNLEPVKYGLVKIKKGFTGDWILLFVAVTKSNWLHLFDFSPLGTSLDKYSQLLFKLKNNLNRGIVSIFDFKKDSMTFVDERNLSNLADEIKDNIDKVINSIYLSVDLRNKNIKLEKDKLIISIDDKYQSGFSSLFGMNIIRLKSFTLTNCYELFFSMTKKNEIPKEETIVEEEFVEEEIPEFIKPKEKIIKVDEENPWVSD